MFVDPLWISNSVSYLEKKLSDRADNPTCSCLQSDWFGFQGILYDALYPIFFT